MSVNEWMRRKIAAQLTDLEPPTLAELEREQAEERYRDSVDRNDPDTHAMAYVDDCEIRLAVHDTVMEEWAQ